MTRLLFGVHQIHLAGLKPDVTRWITQGLCDALVQGLQIRGIDGDLLDEGIVRSPITQFFGKLANGGIRHLAVAILGRLLKKLVDLSLLVRSQGLRREVPDGRTNGLGALDVEFEDDIVEPIIDDLLDLQR